MGSSPNIRPRKAWLLPRRAVQIAVLLAFTIPVLISGWALFGLSTGGDDPVATPAEQPLYGTLSSSDIIGIDLIDPFAALQIAAASKSFTVDWLLFALPILVIYALIRGRAFCGWVCPVNLLLEFTDWLRIKLGIQVRERTVPRHTKLWVALAVIVVSFAVGFPAFEAFSPISAVNKGIILGSTAGLVTLTIIIILELFWSHRIWCRALCPVGGFYEAIGRVGIFSVKIDRDTCIHCDACKGACIADPEILDPVLTELATFVRAGDCMLCGKCIDACPTKALSVTSPTAYGLSHTQRDRLAN